MTQNENIDVKEKESYSDFLFIVVMYSIPDVFNRLSDLNMTLYIYFKGALLSSEEEL